MFHINSFHYSTCSVLVVNQYLNTINLCLERKPLEYNRLLVYELKGEG